MLRSETLQLPTHYHSGTMNSTHFVMLLILLLGSHDLSRSSAVDVSDKEKQSPPTPEIGNMRARGYGSAGRNKSGMPSSGCPEPPTIETQDRHHSSGTLSDTTSLATKRQNYGRWNPGATGPVTPTFSATRDVHRSSGAPSDSSSSQTIREKRNAGQSSRGTRSGRSAPWTIKRTRSAGQYTFGLPRNVASKNNKKKRSVPACPFLSNTLSQILNVSSLGSSQCSQPIVVVLPCCPQTSVSDPSPSENTQNATSTMYSSDTSSSDNSNSTSTIKTATTLPSSDATSSCNAVASGSTDPSTCLADPSNNLANPCISQQSSQPLYNSTTPCCVDGADIISQLLAKMCNARQGSSSSNVNISINLKYPFPCDSVDISGGDDTDPECNSYLTTRK